MNDKKANNKKASRSSKQDAKPHAMPLELMQFNYENLDRAVWKAHHFSWLMTGIFVPVIFGGLGYLATEFEKISLPGALVGVCVVIGVTQYWYAITRVLAGYNSRRFDQLEKLERAFKECYPPALEESRFTQYLRRDDHSRSQLRFSHVTRKFATFLTAISLGIAVAKIMVWLYKQGVLCPSK